MPSSHPGRSRRTFLTAAAALSAHVWIPKPVKGYTSAELRATGPGDAVRPGVAKADLDTPALCVDLDAMESNIARRSSSCERKGRGSISSHPSVAKKLTRNPLS